jgi:hypothetical protein
MTLGANNSAPASPGCPAMGLHLGDPGHNDPALNP